MAKKGVFKYGRRLYYHIQSRLGGYHLTEPVAFLATSASIGVALTLNTLYMVSYSVAIDGMDVAVVEQQQVVEQAVFQVEQQGKSLLGEDYQVKNQINYQFGLHLKSELTDSSQIEHYLYSQLDDLGTALQRYAVKLEGKTIGIVETEEDFQAVLDEIMAKHTTENTISAHFQEEITLDVVYEGEFTSKESFITTLTENTTGETLYTVSTGDTFNAIAYSNDMSTAELKSLNPDCDPDRLFVGDVLSVKEIIPLLSVIITNHENYTESIPCPVENQNDNSIYKGTTKVLTQGVEGEAEISANITYHNGREVERELLETTILREPTTTVMAVGTLEKPVSASYGSFIWPTSGTISSYFGSRTLYGVYDYHSGLDIAAPYGTNVVAADGGTVTFSGWKNSYGNMVIITHDNGTQTYYAHNSSLLVSSGQKVYRGQSIAKVGSTGNSTGNHLHFEVRIGGTAVNPLSYLP